MPIIRLTKSDPDTAVVDVNTDMDLYDPSHDGTAYHWKWRGRSGLLPLAAVAKTINPNSRQPMLRSIWVLCDGLTSGFWDVGDAVTILSSKLGSRIAIPPQLTQAPIRLQVVGPYDRVAFLIGAKNPVQFYSIEIMINTLDEGDVSHPEVPVT